jgi:hypothetical protein
MNTLRLAKTFLIISTVALLLSCGGGSSSSSSNSERYGAVAISTSSLESGVSGGQQTQADAESLAANKCGSGCRIVATFSGHKCATTSYSTGANIMTYGIGSTENEADSNALLNCANGGGSFCSIYRGACNYSEDETVRTGTSKICSGSGSTYICQSKVCTVVGNGVSCPDGRFCSFNSVTNVPVCP